MSAPVYGIDIGGAAAVICRDDGELLRNELGGHRTATCVAFAANAARQLGEASFSANAQAKGNAIGRLAVMPYEQLVGSPLAKHWAFLHSARADGGGDFDLSGSPGPTPGVALLGALLGKIRTTSVPKDAPDAAPLLSVALPPCADADGAAFARAALHDAAKIGGWKLSATPSSAQAAAEALARKYPRASDSVDVLIVDMGASTTTVAAVRLVAEADGWRPQLLCERSDPFLGCADFDALLFEHLSAKVAAKYGDAVKPGSRAGFRLLDGCERLRKLLSTLPEASTTVENLVEGTDVPLSLSRDEMAETCAPLFGRLRATLDAVLATDGLATLHSVEACGGGTRMPAVQTVMSEALAASSVGAAIVDSKFGAKLDDVSVALGAALLGKAAADARETRAAEPASADEAADATDAPASAAAGEGTEGLLAHDELAHLIAREAELAAADSALAGLAAKRNELEGYVIETRSLRAHAKHGGLIDGSQLEPLLDSAEEWLYSDEGESAGIEALESKMAELKQQVGALTAEFHAALAAEREQEERALDASDAERLRDKAAAGEDEDHDTRRLKFPDRMRLVLKNKEEGTELFQGGNFRPAAARYNKALTHAAKFLDLSPDQRTEVNAVKLSLHLNIAMCWLKITDAANNLEQAIRSCNDALELDEANVKALYRRATAYEAKGGYEEAKRDLERAAAIAPDDKAVPKLMLRVEAQIKRQEAKEKKMWSKAFS